MAVIADLQRAVQTGDAALALTACETIDAMVREGDYLALALIDWGDEEGDAA